MEKTMSRKNIQSVLGSYRVYAAFYYEGYFCCAKMNLPAVHRA